MERGEKANFDIVLRAYKSLFFDISLAQLCAEKMLCIHQLKENEKVGNNSKEYKVNYVNFYKFMCM